MIIYFDDNLADKHALQLPPCLEKFRPLLNPTLAKMHEMVSLLTYFFELKFDHIYGCPFDGQVCTPNTWCHKPFSPLLIRNLVKSHDEVSFLTNFLELKFDDHLVDKSAHQNSWCSKLFSPPLSPTLSENPWQSFT